MNELYYDSLWMVYMLQLLSHIFIELLISFISLKLVYFHAQIIGVKCPFHFREVWLWQICPNIKSDFQY